MRTLIILLSAFLISCATKKADTLDIIKQWNNKEIIIPEKLTFTQMVFDTIEYNTNHKVKILFYADSIGCLSCKLLLSEWHSFIGESINRIDESLPILFILNPPSKKVVLLELQKSFKMASFTHPVCIDLNDDFNRLNHFPEDDNFRCFLLDENNRVILIGNPVQNPKIRELYINTICERLGVERPNVTNTQQDKYHADLGTFAWQEAQKAHLVVPNTESENMQIDSIRSSCECTTAVVSKNTITQGDSAVVTITYKAEQAGDFMREVYVYLHNAEPITMRIEGRAE